MLKTETGRISASSGVPASPAGGNGHPLPKLTDAVRVGLCGIGRAGMGMVTRGMAASPHIHIVGGFDILEERTRQLAQLVEGKPFTSFEQILNSGEVELVIIATRSHQHFEMTQQALRAGKDVLVEKPLALDLAGANKLIALAKKLKRRLFVRQNRRFDVPFLQAMQIVESGRIGKLFSVQLRVGGYQRRADWQTLKKFGGGQLLNWGPHLVDWGLQFMAGKAATVWADLKHIAAAGDAEDHVKLVMRGVNGIVVDIEISGAAAITQPPWLLMGSCGSLQIDGKDQCRLRYFDPSKLPKLKASSDTPVGRAGSHFSGGEEIPWMEEEFAAAPKMPEGFWESLYKTMRHRAKFPITLEQARETMHVIGLARKGTRF